MADDAGRARDEEREASALAQQRCAREHRAVRAVAARVVVGAHLARILDERRRGAPGQEVGHHRAVAGRAERRGGGHVAGEGPAARLQRVLARAVELPVALGAVGIAVDVRDVVPHAQQVRVAFRVERRADLPVHLRRGLVQRGAGARAGRARASVAPAGDFRLGYRDASEQHVLGAPEAHAIALAGLGRSRAAPHLADLGCGRQHRRADLRDGNFRRRAGRARSRAVESGDTQHIAPPRRLVLGQ